MITKSNIFEVFEDKRTNTLFTKNLTPGFRVSEENLVRQDTVEYREWIPFTSKLAALILKGCPNIGFRKGDVVLYLGSATGTTVSYCSDIVGKEGFIFAVDNAPRVMRDLIFICEERKNISQRLAKDYELGYEGKPSGEELKKLGLESTTEGKRINTQIAFDIMRIDLINFLTRAEKSLEKEIMKSEMA